MTSQPALPWAPYRLVQPQDRPDYRQLIAHVAWQSWPEFMLQDPVSERHWDDLFVRFPGYQFCLLAPEDENVVGIGNSGYVNYVNPVHPVDIAFFGSQSVNSVFVRELSWHFQTSGDLAHRLLRAGEPVDSR